ncbi:XdhC family protein [Neobacillus dielmonensis]|uniref:XdhC family protein n=1 Tax=Neobacillus dielmonensis TaxID=1347369 RepID=UPI0005A60C2B|nr:XdhC/CoxI family protein [Neobacillus dielmonensis]
MLNILPILEAVQHSPLRGILATIIKIEGSAYLREGTSMFIQEDGQSVGTISPGCLEEDLILRSQEVFEFQIPKTITYDMRSIDDYGWGQGMGCNGIITILLEPITKKLKTDLHFLKTSLQNKQPILHEKKFTQDLTLQQSTFKHHPGTVPQHGNASLERGTVPQHGNASLQRGTVPQYGSASVRWGIVSEGFCYSYVYFPPPVLVVFGAGVDARPLVGLAARVGFMVKVCDWRPGLCNEERFPEADECHIGSPQEIISAMEISDTDFVVIMSHNFRKDQEFLEALQHSNVRYIGLLGSKDRTLRLARNGTKQQKLFFPIGLPIGAQGPEEIAVSIMAEIIQQYRQPNKFASIKDS